MERGKVGASRTNVPDLHEPRNFSDMPRGKTSYRVSNLSLTIPRRIHRLAKVRCLRAGAPSFASYVATLLSQAPEQLSAQQVFECAVIEQELKEKPCGR